MRGVTAIFSKLKWIGYIITAICFYYFIKLIINLDINLLEIFNSPRTLLLVIIYSSMIGFILYTGAFGWKLIISFLSGRSISYFIASSVFIKANIAKYLPGNVMHFAGRNILGRKYDLEHSTAALSTFIEISILVFTSVFLALIFNFTGLVNFLLTIMDKISFFNLALIVAGIFIVLIIALHFLNIKRFIDEKVKLLFSIKFIKFFPELFSLYVIIHILNAVVFYLICVSIAGIDINGSFLAVMGAFILSWLIGFVTPGSPGGLGVRESTLVLLLAPAFGSGPVITAALVDRFVCIMGDLLSFLFQLLLDARKRGVDKSEINNSNSLF